ncbi:G patch domain and KOW motifs-containing protein-like [Poecilia reticulata]|uniref:G patch domain and KOW motifs-containing protein-like n=1 Tax=Poecilia reticulata TaxID=8081 RepID=UPI0004A3B9E6|nr:PREDICTED: G patch domain and KOW motifs-containing protein-like [Poecilia reticulata]
MHCCRSFPLQTKMASHREDTVASKAAISDEQAERKTAVVSFGFTKTVNKFKPATGGPPTASVVKDYLTGIDRNELQSSKPTEKPKELIIPLIQKNRWSRAGQRGEGNGKPEAAERDGDSVESQAVKELIEDSRRQLELWENGPQSEGSLNLSIPLLMQNKVPDGFEEGDHVKVDLRPESVSKGKW